MGNILEIHFFKTFHKFLWKLDFFQVRLNPADTNLTFFKTNARPSQLKIPGRGEGFGPIKFEDLQMRTYIEKVKRYIVSWMLS